MYTASKQVSSSVVVAGGFARPFGPGKTFFWEGDEAVTVYRIETGVVRAVKYDEAGEREVIAFFKPGDVFGVPIDPEYSYTAEAVTAVRCSPLSAGLWEASGCKRTQTTLTDAIRAELKAARERVALISHQSSLERIAGFLGSFSEDSMADAMALTIPQLDIASYLALTPETVCRALKKLKDSEAISMPRRDAFVINDPQALAQFAHAATCH